MSIESRLDNIKNIGSLFGWLSEVLNYKSDLLSIWSESLLHAEIEFDQIKTEIHSGSVVVEEYINTRVERVIDHVIKELEYVKKELENAKVLTNK